MPQQTELVPLGGGYHNVLLRAGDVVLRIEERDPASVRWEHELLAWLEPDVPEVTAPIPARDGSTFLETDGKVVSLLPFVEGEPRAGVEAAELFARIHVRGAAWPGARPRPGRPAYADLDLERNDWWDWSAIVEKPPELVRGFEHVRAWIASGPELAVTTIHGDPAQQNVLWRAGRPAAVLDWEWARLEWAALELAGAAWSFAESDVRSFVAAYRDAGGPGEPEAFQEGERIVVLSNALYSLTRAREHGGRKRVSMSPPPLASDLRGLRPRGAENRDWIDYLLARLREMP